LAAALLRHERSDVLDHDDGIVDENTDRQHHAEHGQHVDGVAATKSFAQVPSSATGTTMVGMMV